MPLPRGDKVAHSGFETERRSMSPKVQKQGYQWPHKRTQVHQIFYKNKTALQWDACYLLQWLSWGGCLPRGCLPRGCLSREGVFPEGCLPGDICLGMGVCTEGYLPAQGDVCLPKGCLLEGCLPRGCTPREQNDRQV